MKNLLAICLLAFTFQVLAQDPGHQRGREEIESYRIAYLTEKLDLTPELAEKFWPVYNEFNDRKKDLRIERSKIRLDLSRSDLDDKTAKQIIDKELALRKQELSLEEEYYNKLSEVLTPTKLVTLLRAEMDFNKEMLRRLRRGPREGNPR